jgi:hypothetical protein
MKKLFPLVLVLVLSGCVSLDTDDPTVRALSQVAFDVAVAELIEKGVEPGDIVRHVDALQSLLEGDGESSVSSLATALLMRVDFEDMPPHRSTAIIATVNILAARAEFEISERGGEPSDTRVVLTEVLQWIENSATLRMNAVN